MNDYGNDVGKFMIQKLTLSLELACLGSLVNNEIYTSKAFREL